MLLTKTFFEKKEREGKKGMYDSRQNTHSRQKVGHKRDRERKRQREEERERGRDRERTR